MIKSFKLIFFLIASLLVTSIALAAPSNVSRVTDGDTVLCKVDDIPVKVRLVGIDAPETSKSKHEEGQPYSQQAKKYLASLVLDKTVEIKSYGLDQYNRVLAELFIDGKNINLKMLKAGLAEMYRGTSPAGFDAKLYGATEDAAKKASNGMWSLGKKYISPSEWRKTH